SVVDFFCHAEDGIRDDLVTGVQTCALPISNESGLEAERSRPESTEDSPAPGPQPPDPDQETRVAIVGRPNVGKSSLVNRLLREERVLVSDMPGTTRDAIDAPLMWHRRRFRIVDTAGMRRPGRVGSGAKAGKVEFVSVALA